MLMSKGSCTKGIHVAIVAETSACCSTTPLCTRSAVYPAVDAGVAEEFNNQVAGPGLLGA